MITHLQATDDKAELILKISKLLMTSGANTNRILMIINKFAAWLKVDAQVFVNHKAFILSLEDKATGDRTTMVKRLPPMGVNFAVISEMSHMAAHLEDNNLSFERLSLRIDEIQNIAKHNRWFTLLSVSLAGAGLSILFGADYLSFIAVFVGTMLGLMVRQWFHKLEYNPYVNVFAGSVTASFTAAALLLPFTTYC